MTDMSRASASKTVAKSASGQRRRIQDAAARAFINGTSEKVTLHPRDMKVALGPEHVLGRGSGSGAHGKSGSSRHRADRQSVRQQLRDLGQSDE
jgi:hypothetical protein